jgi:hypothetical protein
LTSSALAETPAAQGLRGNQRPRVLWVPPGASSSAGREAADLAASAGLHLDDWQRWLLEQGLSERPDGNWLAFEIVELLPRQNGKGGVLEAVALASLYLFGDRFTGWSAHEFKTCREGFLRVRALIENSDHLRRRAKKPRASHGEEELELLSGPRLKFMARSMGAGRGFTGDRLILDEAQHLGEAALEATLPTMSARPNPQVWAAATAPDPAIAPCGVLARWRRRALKGGDPNLVYAEWSINPHTEFCGHGCGDHDDPASVRSWAKANPALGIRISVEHVAREFASMAAPGFARERLGVGTWPTDSDGWQIISEEAWQALADDRSQAGEVVCFAADVTPDRGWGSIGVAGRRPDGLTHVEAVDHRPKTSWMVPRILELQERWKPCAVVIDAGGGAGSLIPELKEAGFEPVTAASDPPEGGKALLIPTMREVAQACGAFYDAATDAKTLRHLGQPELAVALAGALKRPLGDAWAWDRKGGVDISPLVAVTLAAWGLATRGHLTDDNPAPFALFGS